MATEARLWTHPSPLGPGRRISPPPARGFHGELGSAPAPARGAPGPLPRGQRLKSGLQLTLELGRQTSCRQGVLPTAPPHPIPGDIICLGLSRCIKAARGRPGAQRTEVLAATPWLCSQDPGESRAGPSARARGRERAQPPATRALRPRREPPEDASPQPTRGGRAPARGLKGTAFQPSPAQR